MIVLLYSNAIIQCDCCIVLYSAKDGKKVREKIRKLASKVEEDEFSDDLEMVSGFINYKINCGKLSLLGNFQTDRKIRAY